jgi:hypothetical protein
MTYWSVAAVVAGLVASASCGGSGTMPEPPGTGGTGSSCRIASQACAATADCCSGLICTGNSCVAPPQCRAAAGACSVTSDCCNPLVCIQNHCETAPVCGDGICASSEGQTCCQDCGCPTGSTCSGGSCLPATISSIVWSLEDDCASAPIIQVRYFDITNKLVWPADKTQVFTVVPGAPMSVTLSCTGGDKICFGAANADDSLFWGLDINGSKSSCPNCCATCGDGNVPTIPLVCN